MRDFDREIRSLNQPIFYANAGWGGDKRGSARGRKDWKKEKRATGQGAGNRGIKTKREAIK